MVKSFDESWAKIVNPLLEEPYMQDLIGFIKNEREIGDVFPHPDEVFKALSLTSFGDIKVVILGQDPYHNIGQADGLAFSVPSGQAIPPSLRNIFVELSNDLEGFTIPKSGDLSNWANQGVLLLNATLTVRAHEPGSHQNKGWERFTDALIQVISSELKHVVFILWGAYAQKKSKLIDANQHLIIKSAHPSPLSSYRGFFGSKPFSQANAYLISHGKKEINWTLF